MKTIPRSQHRGFTLLEVLVVVGIIGVLAALILPALASSKRMGALAREVSSSRQIMGAYAAYAADHDNQLLPGYADFPAQDVDGTELHNPVSVRYPWRLAPYLKYEMKIFWGADVDDRLHKLEKKSRSEYTYGVSVMPALGINAMYVGGDYQTLAPTNAKAITRYGQFCVTTMAQAENPNQQIVFASAGGSYQGDTLPGYFKVDAPYTNTKIWKGQVGAKTTPDDYGHVDFRWDGKAVAVMLDGHVEMLDPKQMADMRRWSRQAAKANNPDWKLGDSEERND